jgi:hypothetical protein
LRPPFRPRRDADRDGLDGTDPSGVPEADLAAARLIVNDHMPPGWPATRTRRNATPSAGSLTTRHTAVNPPGLPAMAAGGSACARVPARRSASGGRYRPPVCHIRSAASGAGLPAAVTNKGRTGDPRTAGTGWVAVWNRDLAIPVTGMPDAASGQACSPAPCRHAGDLAGSRRREYRAIAVACATGRFWRKREEQRGPERRGLSSCSRRHANA